MGTQRRKHRKEKICRQRSARARRLAATLSTAEPFRVGRAMPHKPLANNLVHVFVDDQNLFWGIVNGSGDVAFRIDFGELLTEVAKDAAGKSRAVRSAYIAGVVPDDDSFWQIAANHGFTVRRGYRGSQRRSKQDDAYLISIED